VLNRPAQDGRRGVSALVAVLLDVGVATVIVDHAVQVDVADSGPLLSAGERMPGAIEARQAGDVDVQQGSGQRPLMATVGLPGALASPGEPELRCSSSAKHQRCHQRWAVAGHPDSIACTRASLPAGPRAALA
jgi:hypothetical protein